MLLPDPCVPSKASRGSADSRPRICPRGRAFQNRMLRVPAHWSATLREIFPHEAECVYGSVPSELTTHRADDRGGIEPAGQAAAERDVAAQVQAHTFVKEVPELSRCVVETDVTGGNRASAPIGLNRSVN